MSVIVPEMVTDTMRPLGGHRVDGFADAVSNCVASEVEPIADSGARMTGYAPAVRDFSTASCVTW